MSSMTEDTGPLDLTALIESQKKELWEHKQKESEWIKTQNQLEGHKKIVFELSAQIKELRKKSDDAVLETSLVKAVGMNSPEMKEAIRTIKNLEIRLAESLEVNESHQKLNGKLQERLTEKEQDCIEVHADNVKLSRQIEDQVNKLRKSGM